MSQIVTPNLNIPAQLSRCLQYVQDAFGAPNAGKSAYVAWQNTQFKHLDRNFPSGLYFPVWFEYWGYVDGVYDRWDHVVIYKDGTCYSSPYTNKRTHDVIGSISEVERIYGCKFTGWSEDIGGLKVIEEDEVSKPTQTEVLSQFRSFKVTGKLPNGDPSQDQLDYYSDREWGVLNGDLLQFNFDRRQELEKTSGKFELIKAPVYRKKV